MAEPRNPNAAGHQDELSADELDEVAGGQDIIVNGSPLCGGDVNTVAGCGTKAGAAAGTVS
ncbi:MAG TPA: hypothetical protein VHN15_12850 [Thermoanaerobaculia bacterium]|nr:hypothetical protein [Thermoanaerobaculia bacterium]